VEQGGAGTLIGREPVRGSFYPAGITFKALIDEILVLRSPGTWLRFLCQGEEKPVKLASPWPVRHAGKEPRIASPSMLRDQQLDR
jgi:hypothetical protein